MKRKTILFLAALSILCVIGGAFAWYFTAGRGGFTREMAALHLPTGVEKIAVKSGVGDSGGNGDYTTDRVVLMVKTDLPIQRLKSAPEMQGIVFRGREVSCSVTPCRGKVFRSDRDFSLTFDGVEAPKDWSGYYFIELIR